jgi:Icc-related predicted phosphoesterase
MAALYSIALALTLAVSVVACGIPTVEPDKWETDNTGPFEIGPYIVPGSDGTVFISVKGRGKATVEYWTEEPGTPEEGKVPAGSIVLAVDMAEQNDLLVATLPDLPLDKRIGYRVRGTRGVTPVYRFRVGRKPNEEFRFAAFGDTRTGHSVHRAVIEAVARERIDFVANSGDLVDRGGVKSQWERFFKIEKPLLVKAPIIPAIGNHDWSGRQYFRRYFMLSRWTGDRRYFIKDWGNLRILSVDSGIECREGCAQYRFAEKALAEGAKQNKLMMIQLHFPPYSAGKHGNNTAVQKPVTDLARRYGVELVVTGHDHNYERTKKIDGTTFVVTGSAGAPIRPVSPTKYTAHARTEPHYVLFDVTYEQITLRAINLEGEVFDSAVIQPNPPRQK